MPNMQHGQCMPNLILGAFCASLLPLCAASVYAEEGEELVISSDASGTFEAIFGEGSWNQVRIDEDVRVKVQAEVERLSVGSLTLQRGSSLELVGYPDLSSVDLSMHGGTITLRGKGGSGGVEQPGGYLFLTGAQFYAGENRIRLMGERTEPATEDPNSFGVFCFMNPKRSSFAEGAVLTVELGSKSMLVLSDSEDGFTGTFDGINVINRAALWAGSGFELRPEFHIKVGEDAWNEDGNVVIGKGSLLMLSAEGAKSGAIKISDGTSLCFLPESILALDGSLGGAGVIRPFEVEQGGILRGVEAVTVVGVDLAEENGLLQEGHLTMLGDGSYAIVAEKRLYSGPFKDTLDALAYKNASAWLRTLLGKSSAETISRQMESLASAPYGTAAGESLLRAAGVSPSLIVRASAPKGSFSFADDSQETLSKASAALEAWRRALEREGRTPMPVEEMAKWDELRWGMVPKALQTLSVSVSAGAVGGKARAHGFSGFGMDKDIEGGFLRADFVLPMLEDSGWLGGGWLEGRDENESSINLNAVRFSVDRTSATVGVWVAKQMDAATLWGSVSWGASNENGCAVLDGWLRTNDVAQEAVSLRLGLLSNPIWRTSVFVEGGLMRISADGADFRNGGETVMRMSADDLVTGLFRTGFAGCAEGSFGKVSGLPEVVLEGIPQRWSVYWEGAVQSLFGDVSRTVTARIPGSVVPAEDEVRALERSTAFAGLGAEIQWKTSAMGFAGGIESGGRYENRTIGVYGRFRFF